jgi:hypothetical protein
MLQPSFYKPNEGNLAHTTGILTGVISQPATQRYFPPDYLAWPSILSIQTAPTQDFANLKTVKTLGVATAQNSDTGNVTIQHSSTSAVIGKGSWFRASVDSKFAGYSAIVNWVGIVTR